MAKTRNLAIDQGTTFTAYVIYTNKDNEAIDITGLTPRAMMRKSYYSSNATTFTASVISNAAGNISIALSAGETSNVKAGRYVYDVELYNANVVYRVQEGIITVFPEVTK